MAVVLNPYLNFRGNAREAIEFYKEVFGGELNVATFADFQASSDPSEEQLVMHSDLQGADGLRLMAADVPNHMEFKPGNNVSMSLSGDDETQLRGFFEKLAEGGQVTTPLEKAQWGDTFGMCVDKFGTQWLVNISGS